VLLGLAYRREILDIRGSIDSLDDTPDQDLAHYLYGSGGTLHVWGLQIGAGTRFGRMPRRPWEFSLTYQMDRSQYPDGILSTSDVGAFYSHALYARLTRSVGFGTTVVAEAPTPVSTRSIAAARAAAELRHEPSRWNLVFDPIGYFGWGIRYGAEWAASDRIYLTAGFRSLRNPESSEEPHQNAGLLSHGTLPVPSSLAIPGFGTRYFFGPDAERLDAGLYGGVYTEILYFNNLNGPVGEYYDNGGGTISGTNIIPQIDVGYRFRLGRRFRLDVGSTVGFGFGEIRLDYEVTADESDAVIESGTEYYRNMIFNNFVVALVTPLY
jgi:hypothetical protein